MSYEIIKSIKIKDNKVYINYASNNLRPLYFKEVEAESLTKILQEKNQESLDLEILQAYEEGDFIMETFANFNVHSLLRVII